MVHVHALFFSPGYGGNIGPNLDGHEDQFYGNYIAVNQDGDYVKPVREAYSLLNISPLRVAHRVCCLNICLSGLLGHW